MTQLLPGSNSGFFAVVHYAGMDRAGSEQGRHAPAAIQRFRVALGGIVQGVGFRPFAHLLAERHGLTGWVQNATDGVRIEVQGPSDRVAQFVDGLRAEAPAAAVVDRLEVEDCALQEESEFVIRDSVEREGAIALVSPDLATCEACLQEVFDPRNRRYGYPFTNCTNCGPRFTIIRALPYDRPQTTMASFAMCPTCDREYGDPSDRRYHAQPNACPECGPRVWLEAEEAQEAQGAEALVQAARLLERGRVVALKGLGGFHLACDATSEPAVQELRRRKAREEKPFALMARAVATVKEWCECSAEEAALLQSPARPIVLLRRRAGCPIAKAVAPGQRYLGFMLPYTPLHALLLAEVRLPAVVMTSGNVTDEPLCHRNADARRRLRGLADAVLMHDREIRTRADDSVVRLASLGDGRQPLMLRRSRGLAPFPVRVKWPLRQVLAVGGDLKNTFCVSRDHYLFLSQHLGDLHDAETAEAYRETLAHFQSLFRVQPEAVAHDLHPDYVSTRVAREQEGLPRIGVQHHHAHLASVLAEHGRRGPVLGVAFDGLGWGADDTAWGGEFLVCTLEEFDRVGHLRPVVMPGGDAATREPWRMALAYVLDAFGQGAVAQNLAGRQWPEKRLDLVAQMIERKVNCPLTTSAGRLFDAVASLVGVRDVVRYEGQAALELEGAAAEGRCEPRYPVPFARGAPLVLDTRPLIRAVVAEVKRGVAPADIAGAFHASLAHATAAACEALCGRHRLKQVALGGGVFQNGLLLEQLVPKLAAKGLEVLFPRQLPCNDGGLSVGQALVADAVLKAGKL